MNREPASLIFPHNSPVPGHADGPRIRIPPPLIFAAGWLAGWALSRLQPFDIDGSGASSVQTGLGTAIIAGGLALAFWGMATFTWARTPVLPMKPARLVVTHGPYRFTRNPMYVGLTLAYLGLSAVLNHAWPVVLLPVVLVVLTRFVIAREEAHLADRFGEEYERYRRQVRRWL